MEFDPIVVIQKLIDDKKLFVSERHMQVEFILTAKKCFPNCKFIPEYVFKADDNTYHIDLMVEEDGNYIAFEFKYVVAGGIISVPGDPEYTLRNHSALPARRYQCVRDIARLETYKRNKKCVEGYFLLITNMKAFWEPDSGRGQMGNDFILSDNCDLKAGSHKYDESFKVGQQCEEIITENNYHLEYKEYLLISQKNGLFKYLLVKI